MYARIHLTAVDGSYTFEEAEAGNYYIRAMKREVGHGSSEEFEVEENATVVVNVTLDEYGGGHSGDC